MTDAEFLEGLGPFRVPCLACGKPITDRQLGAAVMLRTWVPDQKRYVDEGTLHAECGKSWKPKEN